MEAEEDDEEWQARWDENERVERWQPGPEVTLDLYREWRTPRRGTTNPERVSSPVWEWLVRTRVNAFLAADHFGEPDAYDAGAGWCFTRFGRTSTQLPDGRVVKISGEHEDSYDPDFFIYHDVTICHPDGRLEFLLYPLEDFPPTDFHTATLLEDRIVVIGNLGYPADRRQGFTQVMELDLATMKMVAVETSGEGPGWIHRHSAELSADGSSIVIRGGKVHDENHAGAMLENYDEWELSLKSRTWVRLTRVPIERWQFRRKDRKRILLPMLRFHLRRGGEDMTGMWRTLRDELSPAGFEPDLQVMAELYRPAGGREVESPAGWRDDAARVRIDGVLVRFSEEHQLVRMTIEGDLREEIVQSLVGDLLAKLPQVEGVEWEAIPS